MGLLYGQTGRLAEAIDDLTHAEAFNNLGIAEATSGDLDAAEKAFHESLRLSPYDAATANNLSILMNAQMQSRNCVGNKPRQCSSARQHIVLPWEAITTSFIRCTNR